MKHHGLHAQGVRKERARRAQGVRKEGAGGAQGVRRAFTPRDNISLPLYLCNDVGQLIRPKFTLFPVTVCHCYCIV